jgi:hypothetical protein
LNLRRAERKRGGMETKTTEQVLGGAVTESKTYLEYDTPHSLFTITSYSISLIITTLLVPSHCKMSGIRAWNLIFFTNDHLHGLGILVGGVATASAEVVAFRRCVW